MNFGVRIMMGVFQAAGLVNVVRKNIKKGAKEKIMKQILCPHPIEWVNKDKKRIFCFECKQEFSLPQSKPTQPIQGLDERAAGATTVTREVRMNRELRTRISEILIKWHMSTRQPAISELLALINQERLAVLDTVSKEVINTINPDYDNGPMRYYRDELKNEQRHKLSEIRRGLE